MTQRTALDSETIGKAFDVLLDKCLTLVAEDQVLVIKDETMLPYEAILVDRILSRKLSLTVLDFSIAQQEMIALQIHGDKEEETDWVPRPLGVAVMEASAIINVLSGSLKTTAVRRAILARPRRSGCRFAHIPGLADDVLAVLAVSDIQAIFDMSELVAWALGEATHAKLVTRDHNGKTYALDLDLGGWSNEPLMSPGVILPGSWGNVPPGETFCCPNPESVSGQICINGSVPDLVLESGQEIILSFDAGRLVNWIDSTNSLAAAFFFNQQKIAKQNSDTNWNVFAELGIGLNTAIHRLTGNSLFDEKAAHTVHVAIGDNSGFGHSVKASRHADLVSWRPDLYLDEVPIMEMGMLKRELMLSRREAWQPPRLSINEGLPLRILEAEVEDRQGVLHRRLCRKDRVGLVRMAGGETGRALSELNQILAGTQEWTLANLKVHHSFIRQVSCEKLLAILLHYRCMIAG